MELALEAALGWQPARYRPRASAKSVPTNAELREQAKALGLPVPPPREETAARFRSGLDSDRRTTREGLEHRYDRAEAIHRKANLLAIKIASFEV